MTFGESISTCLAKYTSWQGRASRSEYWWWFLFNLVAVVVAMMIDHLIGTTFKFTNPATGHEQAMPYGYVYVVVALGLFLPSLAVMVRRLHDTNHSGWWYWIFMVPLIGAILLLVWFCSRGTSGGNNYGDDPLAQGLADTFR